MTSTDHLQLPFIEGSQAQKHVTHNEALRILDAAIQIAVLDLTRTTPPASPAAGERHIVAIGAGGAWAGQGNAIATWQDGAWAYLAPNTGWCVWSVADEVMVVFDGAHWRDLRNLALDNAAHLGINTAAGAPNLLSVKSNAALFAAIAAADGGSGDVRIQLSKESAAKTASVYFSDAYSGRAEFGLVGSDAFKLKVSADGSTWVEALRIDQASGNLALPRGLSLAGVIAPAQITSSQNDYNPTGLASASVLQISSDAARSVSGLAGGAEGRVVVLLNTGAQPVTLLDESTASVPANRFTLGGNLTIAARQAAMLRYDGTAARWQGIGGGLGVRADAVQPLTPAQQIQALSNLGVPPCCGRLSFVGTTALKFAPHRGDLIKINGALYRIPAAGIAGTANTGVFVNGAGGANLAASTLYYVYAFINAGVVTADFSTTAHATSSTAGNEGVEIAVGADSRTLIGMAWTDASARFADSALASWFNRRSRPTAQASQSITTTSGSEVAGPAMTFVTWADEAVSIRLTAWLANTGNNYNYASLYIDGGQVGGNSTGDTSPSVTRINMAMSHDALLSEGKHAVNAAAASGSGAGATLNYWLYATFRG